ERTGDLRAAADALERARAVHPESPRLARRLRDVHATAGRWSEALVVQGEILLRVHDATTLVREEQVLRGLRYQAALAEPEPRRAGSTTPKRRPTRSPRPPRATRSCTSSGPRCTASVATRASRRRATHASSAPIWAWWRRFAAPPAGARPRPGAATARSASAGGRSRRRRSGRLDPASHALHGRAHGQPRADRALSVPVVGAPALGARVEAGALRAAGVSAAGRRGGAQAHDGHLDRARPARRGRGRRRLRRRARVAGGTPPVARAPACGRAPAGAGACVGDRGDGDHGAGRAPPHDRALEGARHATLGGPLRRQVPVVAGG